MNDTKRQDWASLRFAFDCFLLDVAGRLFSGSSRAIRRRRAFSCLQHRKTSAETEFVTMSNPAYKRSPGHYSACSKYPSQQISLKKPCSNQSHPVNFCQRRSYEYDLPFSVQAFESNSATCAPLPTGTPKSSVRSTALSMFQFIVSLTDRVKHSASKHDIRPSGCFLLTPSIKQLTDRSCYGEGNDGIVDISKRVGVCL